MLTEVRNEILRLAAESQKRARELGLVAPPSPAAVLHHSLAVQLVRSGDAAAAYHLVEVRRLAPAYHDTIIRGVPPPPAR
ncbi:MAG: hypothetical protein EXS38_08950 [Opitutus sp.]|nr:hypothetical protein [Opitutus sp.]